MSETSVSGVPLALFGNAGAPDFAEWDETRVAQWVDALPAMAEKNVGATLLEAGLATYPGLLSMDEEALVGDYSVPKGAAKTLVTVMSHVAASMAASATASAAASAAAAEGGGAERSDSEEESHSRTARSCMPKVAIPKVPAGVNGAEFPTWTKAELYGMRLSASAKGAGMTKVAQFVRDVFADPYSAKIPASDSGDEVTLTLPAADRAWLYAAMVNDGMPEDQMVIIPAEASGDEDGVALLQWWARECYGDRSASTDKFQLLNPAEHGWECTTYAEVLQYIPVTVKLLDKLAKQQYDCDSELNQTEVLEVIKVAVGKVPSVDKEDLMSVITEAQGQQDHGGKEIKVRELLRVMKTRATRLKVAADKKHAKAKAQSKKVDSAIKAKMKGAEQQQKKATAAKSGADAKLQEGAVAKVAQAGGVAAARQAAAARMKGKRPTGGAGDTGAARAKEPTVNDQCYDWLRHGACDRPRCAPGAMSEAQWKFTHAEKFANHGIPKTAYRERMGPCQHYGKGTCPHQHEPDMCPFQHIEVKAAQAGEDAESTHQRRMQAAALMATTRLQAKKKSCSEEANNGRITQGASGQDTGNQHVMNDDESSSDGAAAAAVVLVDGAANRGIWPKTQRNRLKRLRKLKAKQHVAGIGTDGVIADETGDWESKLGTVKNFLVADTSDDGVIVAIKQLTALGYTYVQNENGACLLHRTRGDMWLVEKNGLQYLPSAAMAQGNVTDVMQSRREATMARVRARVISKGRVTCRDAATMTDTEGQMKQKLAEMREHRQKGHATQLKLGVCEACACARMVDKAAVRQAADAIVEGGEKGWVAGVDIFGPMEPDLSGNVYGMVLVEVVTKWGVVELLQSKEATGTLAGLKKLLLDLRSKTGDGAKLLVRVHSDMGTEFEADFDKWCVDHQVQRTTTGGYGSKRNSVVERRIRMLRDAFRANLLVATGGHDYFHALWGQGTKHANYCINRSRWMDGSSPYASLTGAEYQWNDADLVFGQRCRYHVALERREHKGEMPGQVGLWVGRSEKIAGGHVVVPLSYNYEAERWVLGKPLDVVRAKVDDPDNPVFPLRTARVKGQFVERSEGPPGAEFEAFIDKFDPMIEKIASTAMLDGVEATAELGDSEEVYEVQKIVGKRQKKKKVQYKVRWLGYEPKHDSWEYKSNLRGCEELIAEYNGVVVKKGEATIEGQHWDDHAKAVDHLIRRHSLEGDAAEWREGYLTELNAVTDRRLTRVHGDEAAAVLKSGNYVKLRMNPEPKKRTGRKKMRLVAQGFMEPFGWDKGTADAPVAHLSSVRTLVFRGGAADECLSSVDVRTAFLQAEEFDASDATRYVVYQPYKGAEMQVYELRGPLYGARRSGKRWYDTLRKWLRSDGWEPSENDPAVFVKAGMTLLSWVDDLLLRADRADSEKFYAAFRKRFELKDEPQYLEDEGALDFVGLRLTCQQKGSERFYYMDQQEDVKDFVAASGVVATRRVSAPMSDKWELVSDMTPATPDEAKWYKSMYGSISWFAVTTRYDMAYSVHRLGQVVASPTRGAIKAMRRAISYMAQTTDFKIGGVRSMGNDINMSCDSDCGGDVKTGMTTRSVSGRLTLLNQVPVDWGARKQAKTADSPAAAEIMALREAVAAGRLFLWRCRDSGMDVGEEPVCVMHTDSAQAKSFAESTCVNTKLGGVIDRKAAWVRELRDEDKVKVVKIRGEVNPSDVFTKVMSSTNFNRIVREIQGGVLF